MPKSFLDVSNQKFGNLDVIHCKLSPRKRALVKCCCGVEFAVGINSLTSGKTSSCGATLCSTRANDLTGKRFGKLFVQELSTYRNKRGQLYWLCLCDCGNAKTVKGAHMTRGGVDSCGCNTGTKRSLKLRKPVLPQFLKIQFNSYRMSAQSRNLNFEFSIEEFQTFLFKNCFYCDSHPYAVWTHQYIDGTQESIFWNGIDRVDSQKGYVSENCVTCCKICNQAKMNTQLVEFIAWMKRVANNFENLKIKITESEK